MQKKILFLLLIGLSAQAADPITMCLSKTERWGYECTHGDTEYFIAFDQAEPMTCVAPKNVIRCIENAMKCDKISSDDVTKLSGYFCATDYDWQRLSERRF